VASPVQYGLISRTLIESLVNRERFDPRGPIATMKTALIILSSLFIGVSLDSTLTVSVSAANPSSVAEFAGVQPSQSSTVALDKGKQTASVPFEPLLLLLLGSALFSVATAIKVVLSRQFDSNSAQPAVSGKSPVRPRFQV
jgi:hypothetical protein